MMFVGRITKDAVVNQLKGERQVVNFTVALNDYYRPKG
jgi:single-strand DNA-binding protein